MNGDSSRSKAAGGSFSARSNTSADDVQPAAAAGSPTRVSCEQQRQQQQGYGAAGIGLAPVQQLQGLEEDEEAAAADELGWEQLALQDAVRVVDQQVRVLAATLAICANTCCGADCAPSVRPTAGSWSCLLSAQMPLQGPWQCTLL